jgi:sugar phosphate isomerase/epimerase
MTYDVKVTDGTGPPLAFSTLACPDWDAETVIERAAAFGYDAIEWRGGADGTVRSSWPIRRRREVRDAVERAGLRSVAVTSYPNLISGDPVERARSVAEIVDHVILAADLGAPSVRVFVGVRDDDAPDAVLLGRAVDGLKHVLPGCPASGVGLAIEPHDDHVRAQAVRPILDALPDPWLGVVWDIANAWAAGEPPEIGLAAYAGRIRYVQVKDGIGRGDTWRLCALGEGEIPLEAALGGLIAWCGRNGAAVPTISVEWERAWHPDLAPAEVALPGARSWLVDRLAALTRAGDAAARR